METPQTLVEALETIQGLNAELDETRNNIDLQNERINHLARKLTTQKCEICEIDAKWKANGPIEYEMYAKCRYFGLVPPIKSRYSKHPPTLKLKNDKDLSSVVNSLVYDTNVTYLSIGNVQGSVDLLNAIFMLILLNTKITTLNIHCNDWIGDAGCKALSDAFVFNRSITNLSLAGCGISHEGMEGVKTILNTGCITSIDLEGNKIGESVTNLDEFLETKNQVRKVNVARNGIDVKVLEKIEKTSREWIIK